MLHVLRSLRRELRRRAKTTSARSGAAPARRASGSGGAPSRRSAVARRYQVALNRSIASMKEVFGELDEDGWEEVTSLTPR